MLKFWCWVYRVTGYASSHIKIDELNYIQDNLQDFYNEYESNKEIYEEDEISFETFVSLQIGMRQIDLKLYRRWNTRRNKVFWG